LLVQLGAQFFAARNFGEVGLFALFGLFGGAFFLTRGIGFIVLETFSIHQ
jgi:hypothetical protein